MGLFVLIEEEGSATSKRNSALARRIKTTTKEVLCITITKTCSGSAIKTCAGVLHGYAPRNFEIALFELSYSSRATAVCTVECVADTAVETLKLWLLRLQLTVNVG